MSNIGNRLRIARENKGVTQSQVYKDTGIHNKTLSGYERSVSEPDIETIRILSDYYDVSTDYLLGKTDNPNTQILTKEELPNELKDYNIEYIEVIKEAKENDISPETIKKMIQFIKETEMDKKKDN